MLTLSFSNVDTSTLAAGPVVGLFGPSFPTVKYISRIQKLNGD